MTQAPKQAYEAWRITHQSSELAARSAFDTAEMLQQELLTARATISNLERDELTAITQRDDASDFIDKILDEVLGQDRHEWTSAYDRDDALADVEAKMAALKSSKCLHQIAEPAAQSEGEAFQALSELTNALRERHYGRMPAEVQAAYDKAWTIVFTGEKSAPAAPQAVQPALPQGWKPGQLITEEMHAAACKVLFRAHGLEGTPQRMLDAMLSAARGIGATHGQ
ncbi:hypothetical protein [Comamonas sp.]|uniref:hypothetical protein n=1 Tax=Comamonas sp. TaxID=34028 RepID=UPI002FCB2001